MPGPWPRPDTEARYLALVVGAASGVLGALFLAVDTAVVAFVGALLLIGYAVSHASAVHRVSPRLTTMGVALLSLGGLSIPLGLAAEERLVIHTGILTAWIGMAAMAATQWFDHRRTFGMAGLGLVAATLGILAYALEAVFGFAPLDATMAAGWPGGVETWQWVLVPWRLAYLVSLAWLGISGAWLMSVHAREHAVSPPPMPAQRP